LEKAVVVSGCQSVAVRTLQVLFILLVDFTDICNEFASLFCLPKTAK